MIFSLSRTGFGLYPLTMLGFVEEDYELYISRDSHVNYPNAAKRIYTFDGLISFFVSSIIFGILFPFFLFYKRLSYGKILIYIPVLHPWNFWIALCSKILMCPFITTVHEYKMHTGERILLLEWIQKLSILLATKVIFLSKHEADKSKLNDQKKIIIKHPITELAQHTKKQEDNRFHVLFLGRVNQYKGIDILKDAAINLLENPNIRFTIAGRWSIEKTSFPKNTNIKDAYLTEKEMSLLLSQNDVLVLPYTEASQSGVVALGIQSNTPMIVSAVGGLTEQLDSDEAIFISPNSTELTNAIIHLAENKALLGKYQFALEAKKKNYNRSIAEQLNSVLKSL